MKIESENYLNEMPLSCKGNWDNVENIIKLVYGIAREKLGGGDLLTLSGGCFASLYLDGTVKDFDFFIHEGEYYKSIERAIFSGCHVLSHKKNSILLKNDPILFELVCCKEAPIETIKGFDFEHCKSFYDGVSFNIKKDIIENKHIVICDNPVDPYNSIKNSSSYRRIVKLLESGWVLKKESPLNLIEELL